MKWLWGLAALLVLVVAAWITWNIHASTRLSIALQRIERAGWPIRTSDVVPPSLADEAENAAVHLETAAALIQAKTDWTGRLDDFVSNRSNSANAKDPEAVLAAARDFVRTNGPALAEFLKAAGKAESRFAINYPAGYHAATPGLLGMQQGNLLLLSAARLAMDEGRFDEAERYLDASLAMGPALAREKYLIVVIIGCPLLKTQAHVLADLAARVDLRERPVHARLRSMRGGLFRKAMIQALAAERAFSVSAVRENPESLSLPLATSVGRPYFTAQLAEYCNGVEDLLQAASGNPWDYIRAIPAGSGSSRGGLQGLMQSLPPCVRLSIETDAWVELMLQALDPSSSGVDPFSGAPLLRLEKGGELRIYSVGRNGADDGGSDSLDLTVVRKSPKP